MLHPLGVPTSTAQQPSTTRPLRRSLISGSGKTCRPELTTRPSATVYQAAATSWRSSSTASPSARPAPVSTSPSPRPPGGRGVSRGGNRSWRQGQWRPRPVGTLWAELFLQRSWLIRTGTLSRRCSIWRSRWRREALDALQAHRARSRLGNRKPTSRCIKFDCSCRSFSTARSAA